MRTTLRRTVGVTAAVVAVGALEALALVAGGPAGVAAASSSSGALAQAKHELLVRADFPAGWTGQGSVTTSSGGGQNSFPGEDQLAGCLGVNKSLIELNTPSATSPTFQSSDQRFHVQQNLSVFPSTKVANQAYKALANAKVPGCMSALLQGPGKSQLQNAVGHGITLGTVTVTAVPRSVLGAHSSGFVISFPAAAPQGVAIPSHVTIVSSLKGKLGSQLTITAVGSAFPTSLEKHLIAVAYGRT